MTTCFDCNDIALHQCGCGQEVCDRHWYIQCPHEEL